MALLNKQFDPSQHESMRDFSPVPEGEYLARIVASEMKATKNSQGKYLQLEFDLMTPGFTTRKVWTRLNLVNANSSAVEIAERELKSICDAAGVGAIQDSNVLHGRPMVLKLKVTPATPQFGASNQIMAYKTAGDHAGMQQQTIPGMQQASAAMEAPPSWANEPQGQFPANHATQPQQPSQQEQPLANQSPPAAQLTPEQQAAAQNQQQTIDPNERPSWT